MFEWKSYIEQEFFTHMAKDDNNWVQKRVLGGLTVPASTLTPSTI
jgi:hypothetical protein